MALGIEGTTNQAIIIPYSGKLSREKTFTNFAIIPRNAPFLPIRESFLPRKFPAIRYYYTLLHTRVDCVDYDVVFPCRHYQACCEVLPQGA